MSLTPASTDPNRKRELARKKKDPGSFNAAPMVDRRSKDFRPNKGLATDINPPEPTVDPGPPPDEELEILVEVIGELDPANEEHYTEDGLPRVEALEMFAGIIDISADRRDEAFAEFTKRKETQE